MKKPHMYIRRVMNESGLSATDVSQRAATKGYKISPGYIHNLVMGKVGNPTISLIKALAAGLRKPQREVFAAFGVKPARREKKKPQPEPIPVLELPPKRQIGFTGPKKKEPTQ